MSLMAAGELGKQALEGHSGSTGCACTVFMSVQSMVTRCCFDFPHVGAVLESDDSGVKYFKLWK